MVMDSCNFVVQVKACATCHTVAFRLLLVLRCLLLAPPQEKGGARKGRNNGGICVCCPHIKPFFFFLPNDIIISTLRVRADSGAYILRYILQK